MQENTKLASDKEAQANDIEMLKGRCQQLEEAAKTVDDLKNQIRTLESDLQKRHHNLKLAEDTHKKAYDAYTMDLNRVQGKVDDAIREKAKMSDKLNKAMTDFAAANHASAKRRKVCNTLQSERDEPDQCCYRMGYERDTANAAMERLERQALSMKDDAEQFKTGMKQLKEELDSAQAVVQGREAEVTRLKRNNSLLVEQIGTEGLLTKVH